MFESRRKTRGMPRARLTKLAGRGASWNRGSGTRGVYLPDHRVLVLTSTTLYTSSSGDERIRQLARRRDAQSGGGARVAWRAAPCRAPERGWPAQDVLAGAQSVLFYFTLAESLEQHHRPPGRCRRPGRWRVIICPALLRLFGLRRQFGQRRWRQQIRCGGSSTTSLI